MDYFYRTYILQTVFLTPAVLVNSDNAELNSVETGCRSHSHHADDAPNIFDWKSVWQRQY